MAPMQVDKLRAGLCGSDHPEPKIRLRRVLCPIPQPLRLRCL